MNFSPASTPLLTKKFNQLDVLLRSLERDKERLQNKKASLEAELERAKADKDDWERLRDLAIEVANHVQIDVAERISSIVTAALSATGFDYEFKVQFVQRRGTTEADLLFVKDGEELHPLSCSGGGALDIASFALRIALWSLNKSSPVFILDEPFKFLSLDLQENAGNMLHALAERFGLQIIMVSHNERIIAGADNLITVEK